MDFLKDINLVHSAIGLFHTLAAIFAIVFGTIVLLKMKGTKYHKWFGYGYVISMALMIISSFSLYNFGGFSLFHAFSIIATITLIAGVYPVIKKTKGWYGKHYYFMSWSVVGLYCAFWAEIGTRLLEMQYFWWVVLVTTFVTAGIGALMISVKSKQFNFD